MGLQPLGRHRANECEIEDTYSSSHGGRCPLWSLRRWTYDSGKGERETEEGFSPEARGRERSLPFITREIGPWGNGLEIAIVATLEAMKRELGGMSMPHLVKGVTPRGAGEVKLKIILPSLPTVPLLRNTSHSVAIREKS